MTLKQPRMPSKYRFRDKIHKRFKTGTAARKNAHARALKKQSRLRKKHYALTAMLPNLVTLLGLCSGLTALRFAWAEHYSLAIVAVILAAFFDTIDGALARLLKASSRFGAELDSLSDFATFGIVPALIMYMVSLKFYGSLGWVFVLWFAVCGSLRLARFNAHSIEMSEEEEEWKKGFFTGTPITFSALLCMAPLVLKLAFPAQDLSLNPMVVGVWMAAVGFLMISHIPTFSLKKVELSSKMLLPLVVALIVMVSAVFSHPWRTLTVILIGYLVTIPLSFQRYRVLSKQSSATVSQDL